jgi:hypothetical protein
METPNTRSLANQWGILGARSEELVRVFRAFNAGAEPFRKESVDREV